MNKNIDISKIKVHFGRKHAPKDKKLLKFLKMAYSGSLLVTVALIKFEAIEPYSGFMPTISDAFINNFDEKEKKNSPPPLYVYPYKDKFIMSDDYNSYYLYKKKNYSKVMCIVLGDPVGESVLEKSKPFKLPLPTVEVLN